MQKSRRETDIGPRLFYSDPFLPSKELGPFLDTNGIPWPVVEAMWYGSECWEQGGPTLSLDLVERLFPISGVHFPSCGMKALD
jgi:hypothetical protein